MTSDDRPASTEDDLRFTEKKSRPGWVIPVSAAGFIVFGAVSLALAPSILLTNWLPGLDAVEQGKLLGNAAQIVLFGLGGIVAVIGVSLSLARHDHETRAADRDRKRLQHEHAKEMARRAELETEQRFAVERDLRNRFVTSVDLLSSDQSIKRTASLYALGALADDWDNHGRRDEVQVCADVLCGYLRSPFRGGGGADTSPEEISVRQTGYSILRARLAGEQGHSWSNLTLDLRRARIDFNMSLSGAHVDDHGKILLQGASIAGVASVELFGMKVTGGGVVTLEGATVADNARVSLSSSSVRDTAIIDVGGALVTDGGKLTLDRIVVADSGHLLANGLRLTEAAQVDAREFRVDGYGCVEFNDIAMNEHASLRLARLRLAGSGGFMLANASLDDDAVMSIHDSSLAGEASLDLSGVNARGRSALVVERMVRDGGATIDYSNASVVDEATFDPPW